MRFLSVAERELRAAARREGTYRLRWVTGIGFFGLLLWLAWVYDLFTNRNHAAEVFQAFAMTLFFFCLAVGSTSTADSLSREKREGTLGLLFLTNLNSVEIVAGKLCANALATAYSLVEIFPILALPLMIGGITLDEFARVVLVELTTLLFAITAGFVASALCVRQFPAVALAVGMALFFGAGLLAGAEGLRVLGCPGSITTALRECCPLNAMRLATLGRRAIGMQEFWETLTIVAVVSLATLGLTAWGLRHSWQDRPKCARPTEKLKVGKRIREHSAEARLAFRRRLLEINPFFWLAGRQRVSAPVFMGIVVVICAVTSFVAGPYFGRVMRVGTAGPILGQLISWLWAGLAIHAFVLYYAAAAASRQLAEDKQSGALELILSTPTSEPQISRGLWLAYARRMLFPGLVGILVHVFFVWICMTMAVFDPPGRLPPNATPGEVFWCALWDIPLRGHVLDWQFGFMLRIVLLLLLGLIASWIMLGWVGRWLGLRLKHPGFAPLVAVALAVAPPTLLFSLVCYFADQWRFFGLPDRQSMPLMLWIAFGICLLNCFVLSLWAAGHLRDDFRATVIGRFSESTRRWWQADWPRVRRQARRAALVLSAVAILAGAFYGYQSWRSHRAWVNFQRDLRRSGHSLDVTPFLPQPVAAADNFAASPAFRALSDRMQTVGATRRVLDQLVGALVPNNTYSANLAGIEWARQQPTPLAGYFNLKAVSGSSTNRRGVATAVLQTLAPQAGLLTDLAAAARLPRLQFTTNRSAADLLAANPAETSLLERLQMLFQIRACASLATGQTAAAAEDVLTGIRLARLARQLPDARASIRVQFFLMRTLQALWEGLAEHQWNDAQLQQFQDELASFNLLADYTNSVRRLVLLNIDLWLKAAESADASAALAALPGSPNRQSRFGPRTWWAYYCIQLYRAGERAIESVDGDNERIRENVNWSDTSGLPLETDLIYFLQQGSWWGPKPALVSFAQTSVNQAVVGCALERFLLARGEYPQTLEALVPAWLKRIPADTQRGRPLTYERIAPDRFILRGVGPNGMDDRKNKSSDDWLWAYSTNAPAAKR